MSGWWKALVAVMVAATLVFQVTVVTRIPLPGGVGPDLVLLVVIALAMVSGPPAGAAIGFLAGLAADIAPPADHAIGRYALVLCLVGYLCGLAADDLDSSGFLPFLVLGTGVVGGALLYAGIGATLGDPRVTWDAVSSVLPISLLYDLILSPFVLYVVTWLARRVDPRPTGYETGGLRHTYRQRSTRVMERRL